MSFNRYLLDKYKFSDNEYPTHIKDDIIISDKKMTFGEYKKTNEYKENLKSVFFDVVNGQHLRFIGSIYKNYTICLLAVKNSPRYDMYSVPIEIHEKLLQELKNNSPSIYKDLPEEFKKDI